MALGSSGAAEYLVNAISPVLSNLPPIILLGAITFLMLLTTQFLMNSSATVLVLPIAIMLDTKGPEIRTKTYKDGKIEITREPVPAEKFERYGIPVYPL